MKAHELVHVFLLRWGDAVAWQVVVTAAVLGAVLLLTMLLPRAGARTRHALVLLGLAQLLLPGALLLRGLGLAGFDLVGWLGLRAQLVVAGPAMPVTAPGEARPLPAGRPDETRCRLAVAWGAGMVLLVASSLVRRRQQARRLRPAEGEALATSMAEATVAAALKVAPRALFGEVATPRVVGIVRPRLVLPEGIEERLGGSELEAVLAHELAHVARRDTLWQAFASVLAALFWFDPLVWIARRRLADEAEQACDEHAAGQVGAEAYVASLREVCSSALVAPGGTAACMSSRRLAHRVEVVLRSGDRHRRAWVHALALLTTSVLVVASGLGAAAWAARNDPPPTPTPREGRYEITGMVRTRPDGKLTFEGEVAERTTHVVVSAPRIVFEQGKPASARSGDGTRRFELRLTPAGERVAVELDVVEGGVVTQHERVEVPVVASGTADRATGELYTLFAAAMFQTDGATSVWVVVSDARDGRKVLEDHIRLLRNQTFDRKVQDGGRAPSRSARATRCSRRAGSAPGRSRRARPTPRGSGTAPGLRPPRPSGRAASCVSSRGSRSSPTEGCSCAAA